MNFNLDPKTTRAVLITGVIVFTLLLVSNFLTTRYTVKQTIAEVLPTVLPEAFEQIGLVTRPTNPPIPTVTPKVRLTPTVLPVTLTATPVFTSTPTIINTPPATSTPLVMGCDETKWHKPMDIPGCHHHHGVNPADYEQVFAVDGFSITAWLDEHGELLQPATMTENENPVGRVFIYVHAMNGGCEKDFEGIATPVPDEYNCVTDVVYGVHAMAHLSHLLGNGLGDHSEVEIARVCTVLPNGQANQDDCAIFAGAVRQTYPILHADYKQDICYLPSTPKDAAGNLFPLAYIDQPPYVTILPLEKYDPVRSPGVIQSYWVGTKPNPTVQKYHRPGINSIVNSAWLELDVWGALPKELVCGKNLTVEEVKAILNTVPPLLENAHLKFKLNDFTVLLPPVSSFPFEGYVNEQGKVVPDALCATEGQTCWPVFYSANYKAKAATLHRGAEPGGCDTNDENPCIIFEFPFVEMIYPLYDIPHDH